MPYGCARGERSDVGDENVNEDKFEDICKRNANPHCPNDGIKTQSICQKIQGQKANNEFPGERGLRKMQLSRSKEAMDGKQCPQGHCKKVLQGPDNCISSWKCVTENICLCLKDVS